MTCVRPFAAHRHAHLRLRAAWRPRSRGIDGMAPAGIRGMRNSAVAVLQ